MRGSGRGSGWAWALAMLVGLGAFATLGAQALAAGAPVGASASVSASPALLPGVGSTDWPVFQGQDGHNAVVTTSGAAAGNLSTSWRFLTGSSIVVAPSVVHGVAYLTSMGGWIDALNVASGRLLWSFHADNQIMSQALVVGGRVYFGSGNKGFSGTSGARLRGTGPSAVYALNAQTGRLLWSQPVRGEAMPTPAFSQGLVYEPTGGGMFYAFDAVTGRLRWRLDIGSIVSMSSPVIAGTTAVFGGTAGGKPPAYYGIDLETHRVAWTDTFPAAWGGPDDLSPSLVGGDVYVQVPYGSQAQVGTERCSKWPCGGAASWVPSNAGPIKVAELDLNSATGRQIWQRRLGAGPASFHGGEEAGVATVLDGVAYVGTPVRQGLWAFAAQTGRLLWKSALPAAVRTAPTVVGNRIYAESAGTVYVLRRSSGAVEGAYVLAHRPKETVAQYTMIPCTFPAVTVFGRSLLVVGGNQNTLIAMPLASLTPRAAVPSAAAA